MTSPRFPRSGRLLAGTAIITASGVLAVGAFPWGLLRAPIERRMSAQLGRPATIGAIDRVDGFGFTPTLRITDVRIPQPGRLGRGDMLRVAQATVRIPLLPLLRGKLLPTALDVSGLRLVLVRDAAGRWNYENSGGDDDAADDIPRIRQLRIADSRVRIVDARRRLDLEASLAADERSGVRVSGRGTLRGSSIRVTAHGGALNDLDPAARYPFGLTIASPAVTLSADGTMDRPLDLGHFSARVTSHGDDLKSLDAIVQAGIPATQQYRLRANLRRDAPGWAFTRLSGMLGRSDLAGTLTVTKREGRTFLDADIRSRRFDFDDLSSDAARARAAARDRAIGRRVLPGTRIRLDKLDHTDGRLRFVADSLLMPPGSRFRSLSATLTLDHRRLVVDPLHVGLTHGALSGSMLVDHRASTQPRLTMRLRMRGARIEDVLTRVSEASGPLSGRIALDGSGPTLRAAIAASSGTIGLVAREGHVARTLATLAAGDLLRGAALAIGKSDTTVPIRCLIGRFTVRGGRLSPAPLLIDTPVMRADGHGSVDLATERLALIFTGRSKRPDLIQSAAPVRISGTLADPRLDVTPPDPTGRRQGLFAKVGAFLKTIRTRGDAGRGVRAPDADCARLEDLALR
ncbi:AsmA family protein [Sphingomonas montana]|uniref:AsmA family protein n=1 Tax=Sphingomonas montana TaxID=1843236 RepID=UPI00096F61C5|nr:AsmA-like C-terminal region-containing protein [Sphingomonas montana]